MHGVLRRQCPTATLGVGHLISAFVYRILKWIFHKAKANRENRPGATMPVRSIHIIEVLASG